VSSRVNLKTQIWDGNILALSLDNSSNVVHDAEQFDNDHYEIIIKSMNQDFSELIQYLDNKFGVIDKRFDEVKNDFIELQGAVDTYAKKADTYFQEMVMLAHKVDRHEKWLQQIANKLGLELDY